MNLIELSILTVGAGVLVLQLFTLIEFFIAWKKDFKNKNKKC